MSPQPSLHDQIVALLAQHPNGLRVAHLAHALQTHTETIARALITLERQGVLLQEDDKGRIALAQQVC